MAKAKLRKKKKEGVMTLGGKIITVFFILLLIGGGYFLFTLFRPVEINSINMTGEWKLSDNGYTSYWSFEPTGIDGMSGTASHYNKQAGTGVKQDVLEYNFVLEENDKGTMELHMTALKYGEKNVEMKVTSLSNAQMGIVYNASEMANMTKTNLF